MASSEAAATTMASTRSGRQNQPIATTEIIAAPRMGFS